MPDHPMVLLLFPVRQAADVRFSEGCWKVRVQSGSSILGQSWQLVSEEKWYGKIEGSRSRTTKRETMSGYIVNYRYIVYWSNNIITVLVLTRRPKTRSDMETDDHRRCLGRYGTICGAEGHKRKSRRYTSSRWSTQHLPKRNTTIRCDIAASREANFHLLPLAAPTGACRVRKELLPK